MSRRAPGPARGPRRCPTALAFLVLFAASPLGAQVTDTLRTPPADTVAAQDTVPPPTFFRMLSAPRTDHALGTYHWDRDDLLRENAPTLLDLLARVPGITTFRSGLVLQPEIASTYGGAGGRIAIVRDGFVLDSYDAPAFDLSRIPLIDLEEVTVERRTDLLLVRLRTAEPRDARPYSRVEAGLGRPEINLFRGLFLAPRVVLGPLALGIERLDSDGERRAEPADLFAAWLKWSLIGERRGIQVDFRSDTHNREPESPWPTKHRRVDLVVRARNEFAPGLHGEVHYGNTSIETETLAEVPPEDSGSVRRFERSGRQIGVRAAYERDALRLDAAARFRSHEALPSFQGDVGAAYDLSERLSVHAALTREQWRDAGGATAINVRAVAGPVPGLRGFLEYSTGVRGAATFPHDTFPAHGSILTDARALRVGGDLRFRALSGSAVFVDLRTDSVASFGVPFDTVFARHAGGAVRGWEGYARVDLFGGRLAPWIDYRNWLSGARWVYLPAQTWRAGLDLQWLPLASGNLELTGHFVADHRGAIGLPPSDPAGPPIAALPSRTVLYGDLTLRIIDIRIFLRYDDWTRQEIADIPGQPILGPRFFYGVKWHFWN